MKNLYNYTLEDLEKHFTEVGEKKFKATQVFEWLYSHKVNNIDDFSNIKKDLRDKIKAEFTTDLITISKIEIGDGVKKYLFKLFDDNYIEAVLMIHDYGSSVCISSQVGCNMGCKFCESGRIRKIRDLETYEMVMQIMMIINDIKDNIDSVVIMGIGEPFDNYDRVINFIKIINNQKGLSIGARHITVSTCGIIPKIEEFSHLPLQINLAISLHAPTDEIRNEIMPISKKYKINDLIIALKQYIEITNRRVTIEYVMLSDINDSETCAIQLATLLRGMNIYVNLIPYNETNNLNYKKSDKIKIFQDKLLSLKINCTVRREFGSNISAACGQLRSKEV